MVDETDQFEQAEQDRFDEVVAKIKNATSNLSDQELQKLVDEALAESRDEKQN